MKFARKFGIFAIKRQLSPQFTQSIRGLPVPRTHELLVDDDHCAIRDALRVDWWDRLGGLVPDLDIELKVLLVSIKLVTGCILSNQQFQ